MLMLKCFANIDIKMSNNVTNIGKAKDIKQVGGKAISLAKLLNAGFNVPDGFVIKTGVKLTPAVESEILESFNNLGARYVAVRSSATAEDGKKSSFAGQFDTFLNTTRQDLIANVKKCLDSANSARVEAYSKDMHIAPGKVAVIVQKMVEPDFSGVAFSANPVTNDRNQIIIETTGGLGDKLVSGEITPDTYIVSDGRITSSNLKQLLSNNDIHELCNIIRKVETLFGFPVDVEWAFAGSEFYILQSRPITTLG